MAFSEGFKPFETSVIVFGTSINDAFNSKPHICTCNHFCIGNPLDSLQTAGKFQLPTA